MSSHENQKMETNLLPDAASKTSDARKATSTQAESLPDDDAAAAQEAEYGTQHQEISELAAQGREPDRKRAKRVKQRAAKETGAGQELMFMAKTSQRHTVSVRTYNGTSCVEIRQEACKDSTGKHVPIAKILLTEVEYDALKAQFCNVDTAIADAREFS
jgi:hypothetical protein